LAFLQAFSDDSASETGDRRLFMAGYVNRAEAWSSFAEAWATGLQEYPSIGYLKMVEAVNLRDQFKGWGPEQRDEKLRCLARIIHHFKPLSFEFSLSRKIYYSDVKPAAPRGLGNPYFSCAFSVVSGIARFVDSQQLRLPIDFIFDEQTEISSDINLFFEFMTQSLPKGVRQLINGNPIFRDDKMFLPLQAADMLAWHTRRGHEIGDTKLADWLRNPNGHLVSEIEDDTLRS
jgi:Protein of unknown function (DUF3800)